VELLKEICHDPEIKVEKYRIRRAARAIVLNDKGEIALMNVTKQGYYKIAGGGIEFGEDIQKALAREILEEVGATAKVLDEIGVIIEYRNKHALCQKSYCYVAKVIKLGKPDFTELEKSDGFSVEWHNLDNAIALMKSSKAYGSDDIEYTAKYMVERDLLFLITYKNKKQKLAGTF